MNFHGKRYKGVFYHDCFQVPVDVLPASVPELSEFCMGLNASQCVKSLIVANDADLRWLDLNANFQSPKFCFDKLNQRFQN